MTSDVSLMKVDSLVTRGGKYTIEILANKFCRTVNCGYNWSSRVVYFMYFRLKVEHLGLS